MTKHGIILVERLAVITARKNGLKIIHYSLMHNHLHLIIEAKTNEELSRSLQRFALSLSKLVKFSRRPATKTILFLRKFWVKDKR